jgi:exodeoxyribonuclease V alpha subunit
VTDGDKDLFDGGLRGTVARVIFENRESGWAVVHVEPDNEVGVATVIGPLAPVTIGECLEIQGEWESDSRWGRQFRARSAVPADPTSVEGTRRYLASGVVPGIGPELARRLVARFGTETLAILDDHPERLLQIRGIGAKRLELIKEGWQAKSAERQGRVFLQGNGLGAALAQRVLRAWGDETITRVKRDPYALIREVAGIGFRTADDLALRVGVARDAPQRMAAGVLHALQVAAGAGHCFLPAGDLGGAASKLLQIDDAAAIEGVVQDLVARGRLVIEPPAAGQEAWRVWDARLHAAECRVSSRLAELAVTPSPTSGDRVRAALAVVEDRLHITLAPGQSTAVENALTRSLLVVTGGPGTGKTTLIRAVVACAERLDLRIALAAPTGRAAKRIEQTTDHEARTLHRWLEYRFDIGFARDADNPLDADLVVVDEMSMVDLQLMDALIAALKPGSRLLLVGDADQLPPVGPGAVLRDLVETPEVPAERLQVIFRQAQASQIVRNAHRINAGELPQSEPEGEIDDAGPSDFYLIEPEDADHAADLVRRLVTRRLPERFGVDPRHDLQVLAPMHRGRCGVSALNAMLQDALNPGLTVARPEAPRLRAGDRVMQLRNDYDREVFNGDIGHVIALDEESVSVDFDGRVTGYKREEAGDLALAYASTVHKSQGSEYPGVIVVLMPEHHIMLQRNLLYTALTRASRVAVLVAAGKALRRAVRNASPAARNTALTERLRKELRA